MKFFFIDKLLKFLGRKLDGYKTKIAGIGWLLLGLVVVINAMFPDSGLAKVDGLEEALTYFSTGMTALGLGGKGQKILTAIKE
jgi:hypothetical protein